MMTIPQYLNKVHSLCSAPTTIEYFNAVELENCMLKIPLDQNEDYFLQPILFQKKADESLSINTELVRQMASCLGLVFIAEEEKEGNVCFANSGELRPEFKQAFTEVELLAYHYTLLHSRRYREANKAFLKDAQLRILIPPNADFFWKLVQIGKDLFRREGP
jgi:hypothetical protein